jgi:hypothetical protein
LFSKFVAAALERRNEIAQSARSDDSAQAENVVN